MNAATGQQSGESATLLLRGERSEIERAQAAIAAAMERLDYPEPTRFAVRLAVEEALSNAIRHGHRDLPPEVPVRFEFRADPGLIEVVVEDAGPGFDPDAVPDPTLDENLELPAGRGLLLMRAYMTRVTFNPKGNRVTMVHRLAAR
jgi:serine/threonine-protein kinase RsbW